MKLAANLTLLYSNLPVHERFAAAAKDGFRHVEILSPYDESPDWYAQQLQRHGLQLVLVNTPVMSPDHPVGVAAQPAERERFREAMHQVAAVCRATGCTAVHVMAGKRDPACSRETQSATLHDNLRWASRQYPDLTLQLEALNSLDVPGYFYSVPEQVAQELAVLNIPQAGMQFDFYHVVREGLSPAEQVERHFPWIRHVQIAGAPDRHEPDLARHDLMAGTRRLRALGYDAFMGLEYRPETTAGEGLAWIRPLVDEQLIVCRFATK